MKPIWKWTRRVVVALLALLVIAVLGAFLWVRGQLTASLPVLAGEEAVDGLHAPLTVERDALGVPTIRASGDDGANNRLDIALATGYLHAQERFFQMDILRRQSAGEMAELLGERLLGFDRRIRVHRFRAMAEQLVENASPGERALVDAYTRGVNAGLAGLDGPSFEYLVLQTQPEPWVAEDSYLTLLTMFVMLHDEWAEYESMLGILHDTLPADLFEFLTPMGTPAWDAPLTGEPVAPPVLPTSWGSGDPSDDASTDAAASTAPDTAAEMDPATTTAHTPGASAAWAFSGQRTHHGAAMLALDMHLGLVVPNIWYRANFRWTDGGTDQTLHGVTLPGAPLMVVGTNGHVAWGFTNSRIDTADVILLTPDPENDDRYLTPEGAADYQRFTEVLHAKGDVEENLEVLWTEWGPVLPEDAQGQRRALRWVAHDLEAVDFSLLRLESASTAAEAIGIAQTSGLPAQNFLAVDREGHIGWSLAGRIPDRPGCGEPDAGSTAPESTASTPAASAPGEAGDAVSTCGGRLPGPWATAPVAWEGLLDPAEVPSIIDPPSGRLWSANHRHVDGEDLEILGDGNYVLGVRAHQIRNRLQALERATEEDMLAIQLDDRAFFFDRWRDFLLESVLTENALAADPQRQEMRNLVEAWDGHASVDSAGYHMIREFRDALAREVFEGLTAPSRAVDPELDYYDEIEQAEAPLWQLVQQRPAGAHHPQHATWDAQFLAAVDTVIAGPPPEEGEEEFEPTPLAERTHGEANRAQIRHLFSRAVPFLSRWLDMPAEPLPGDVFVPRVQLPSYGASQRLVVSPGHEDQAIFHMPTGQSGHPLSPFYRNSHQAWVEGTPTPLLPGATAHTLHLKPAG